MLSVSGTGTNSSFQATPATCGPCQCALVAAVAPLLQDAGVILSTEMYTANAVLSITQSIRNCSREFALQLLESESGLKLSQLLSLDTCTPDDKITTQCMSQPGSASGTAANASASGNATVGVSATDGSNALNELMRDASCALAGKTEIQIILACTAMIAAAVVQGSHQSTVGNRQAGRRHPDISLPSWDLTSSTERLSVTDVHMSKTSDR